MLAYVLPRVLAALSGLDKTLPHLQAHNCTCGFTSSLFIDIFYIVVFWIGLPVVLLSYNTFNVRTHLLKFVRTENTKDSDERYEKLRSGLVNSSSSGTSPSGRLRRQGQRSSPSQGTANDVTTTYIIIAFGWIGTSDSPVILLTQAPTSHTIAVLRAKKGVVIQYRMFCGSLLWITSRRLDVSCKRTDQPGQKRRRSWLAGGLPAKS